MRRTKPKRTRTYRPKHIHIPVMPELQREFMYAGHGALAALRFTPNIEAFDQLASLFNVIYVAVQQSGRASAILESGMLALRDAAARYEKHGVLEIRRFELLPLQNALLECEKLVADLDVMGLHVAGIKTRILQQMSPASTPLELA